MRNLAAEARSQPGDHQESHEKCIWKHSTETSPGGPIVKTHASTEGGMGLTPGQETKT